MDPNNQTPAPTQTPPPAAPGGEALETPTAAPTAPAPAAPAAAPQAITTDPAAAPMPGMPADTTTPAKGSSVHKLMLGLAFVSALVLLAAVVLLLVL